MFVNTLVLRTRVEGGESFEQVLGRVRGADLEAFGHADLPFERLVEVLNPERSTARHPLFQVMLSFQNLETGTLELPRLTVEAVDLDIATAKFDLQFVVAETPTATGAAEYSVGLTYATDLFDTRTVERVAERFVHLLDAVTGDLSVAIGDVDLLDDAERVQVLEQWNDTDRALDDTSTLVDLFAEQVRRSPDARAVEFEGESLTYGDFSERVNRLARHLISLGVGPTTSVGLAMRRSLDLLVGMYAVVTAGGAYVPIDPDQPDDRNGYILDIAAPVVVLSTERDGFRVPGERSVPSLLVDTLDLSATASGPVIDAERTSPLRASNTAYVIFTSGSTGRPEGCGGAARRDRQPPALDAARIPAHRRRRGAAEDPVHLRRVGVGVLLALADRRPAGGRRARRSPRPAVSGVGDRTARRDRRALRAVDARGVRRRGIGRRPHLAPSRLRLR